MTNDKELIALLKEARRIIRGSLSMGLYQDWDRRATKALAVARGGKGPLELYAPKQKPLQDISDTDPNWEDPPCY